VTRISRANRCHGVIFDAPSFRASDNPYAALNDGLIFDAVRVG
jgi:hypothetical protein